MIFSLCAAASMNAGSPCRVALIVRNALIARVALIVRVALIALTWMAAGVASAQTIYKWVDDSGVIHYTESPPGREGGRDSQVRRLSPTDQELARAAQERRKAIWDAEERETQRLQEIDALKEGSLAPVPGETAAAIDIQREVLRAVIPLEWKADPDCFRHQVSDTKRIEAVAGSAATVERWTLDRCGELVNYRVTLTALADGKVQLHVMRDR
jgi:hypothetical protein